MIARFIAMDTKTLTKNATPELVRHLAASIRIGSGDVSLLEIATKTDLFSGHGHVIFEKRRQRILNSWAEGLVQQGVVKVACCENPEFSDVPLKWYYWTVMTSN
jgi:hypothetical protein